MKLFRHGVTLPHLIVLGALFWVVAPYVPRLYLFDLLNALAIGVWIGVAVAYLPGIKAAFERPFRELSSPQLLLLGIGISAVSIVGRTVWNWYWRYLGKPDDVIDHLGVAFFIYTVMIAGLCHLFAKDEPIKGEFPRRAWLRIGISVAVALAIGLLFVVFFERPHLEQP